MLQFFNKNYISRYLILFVLTLVFWFPSFFISGNAAVIGQTEELVLFSFQSISPILQVIIAFFITYLTSVLLNQIANEYSLSGSLTTYTSFLFLIIACSLTTFTTPNHFILINFILVFVYRDLFRLPHVSNSLPIVLNASLLIAVASFFYLPLIFLIVLIWYGLMNHRINSWRNYVVSIIGLLIPYLFLFTWFFLSDNLIKPISLFSTLFSQIFPLSWPTNYYNLVIAFLLIFMFIISALKVSNKMGNKGINLRQNLGISFFGLFIALAIVVLFGADSTVGLLLGIPMALIASNFITDIQNFKKLNLALASFILLILISHYYSFFLFIYN